MKHIFLTCLLLIGLTSGCGKKTTATAQNPASLDELNRAFAVVSMHGGSAASSTNELARFLALGGKTMPVPPPGKKLAFDPAKQQFVLVDQ